MGTHDLEMEKVKTGHLEDDNERLKQQLADGEKRHEKINKVHSMIKEFQIQIQEATEENERLTEEIEQVCRERDEGFADRDAEIERLKALLGNAGQNAASNATEANLAAQAEIERLRALDDQLTAEKNKLKDRLIAAAVSPSPPRTPRTLPSLR